MLIAVAMLPHLAHTRPAVLRPGQAATHFMVRTWQPEPYSCTSHCMCVRVALLQLPAVEAIDTEPLRRRAVSMDW